MFVFYVFVATTPEDILKRYRKVLQAYKRGKNLRDSYRSVGVDRNTICCGAPIAELAIVSPTTFEELRGGFSHGEKLLSFIERCRQAIENDPELIEKVGEKKKTGQLLPLKKRL